jgi:hypothetical protein
MLQQNLYATSDRLDTATTEVNDCSEEISQIGSNLADVTLDPPEIAYLKPHL